MAREFNPLLVNTVAGFIGPEYLYDGTAGVNFIMGHRADDIMVNYQSASFHIALYLHQVSGLQRAPEFDQWRQRMENNNDEGKLH